MKYFYYALLVSGLSILLIRRSRLDERLLLFIPLLSFAILTELIFDILHIVFIYHIYQAIECVLLCTYYFLLLNRRLLRRLILLALIAYLCYFTAFFIRFPDHFLKFDPIDFVVEDLFITIFSLYYLVDLYRSGDQVSIDRHPHFWISSGNLVFYSGASLFMSLAITLMTHNVPWYKQLGTIVKFLNIILYITYIKAFLCTKEKVPA